MKLIDLLVKKANKEELPKKIKFDGDIYILTNDNEYENEDNNFYLEELIRFDGSNLNNEVEILEDTPKKLKKLSYQQIGSYLLERNEKLAYTNEMNKQIHKLGSKINEIIDKIEELENKQ